MLSKMVYCLQDGSCRKINISSILSRYILSKQVANAMLRHSNKMFIIIIMDCGTHSLLTIFTNVCVNNR